MWNKTSWGYNHVYWDITNFVKIPLFFIFERVMSVCKLHRRSQRLKKTPLGVSNSNICFLLTFLIILNCVVFKVLCFNPIPEQVLKGVTLIDSIQQFIASELAPLKVEMWAMLNHLYASRVTQYTTNNLKLNLKYVLLEVKPKFSAYFLRGW